jgi:molecular chaperone GrpE (heat shock protein)
MKTVSLLKEEKKAMNAELQKSKVDFENLREATEKYKLAVDKYKVDHYNAEKSADEIEPRGYEY